MLLYEQFKLAKNSFHLLNFQKSKKMVKNLMLVKHRTKNKTKNVNKLSKVITSIHKNWCNG